MKFIFHCLLLISIAGCGSTHNKVIIDPKGVDMAEYQQDLNSCFQIAEQVEERAVKGAAGGAVIGGLVGAVVGNKKTAQKVAGVGAIKGGLSGAKKTEHEKNKVVRNCMRGRGYRVLN